MLRQRENKASFPLICLLALCMIGQLSVKSLHNLTRSDLKTFKYIFSSSVMTVDQHMERYSFSVAININNVE